MFTYGRSLSGSVNFDAPRNIYYDASMRNLKRAPLWALLFLLMAACGASKKQIIVVDGIRIYAAEWEKTKSELATRMRLDTKCASRDLQFTLFTKWYRSATEVWVSGCGKRVLYTRNTGGLLGSTSPWYTNTPLTEAPTNQPLN